MSDEPRKHRWHCEHCGAETPGEQITPTREHGLLCRACAEQLPHEKWSHTADDIAYHWPPRRQIPDAEERWAAIERLNDQRARLGRALEASPSITQDAIARVLTGQALYDDVPDAVQTAVRGVWDERVEAILDDLDFTDRLRAAGKPWAEADDDGNLVMRLRGT